MCDDDDIRSLLDPIREIAEWFWDHIAQAKQERIQFQEVCREMERTKLKHFIVLFDILSDLFTNPPFIPPLPTESLSQYLAETGYWVISQGHDFFVRVWQDPAIFWKLKQDNVMNAQSERSYIGIPEQVWAERFPGEYIPGHRQDD